MSKAVREPEVLRTLDLFSGCGGMTEGLSNAGDAARGFSCVGAIDNWEAACDSFDANHPVASTRASVERSVVGELLNSVGDVDVVVGGPPCQGFSTSGKRALDDPRNKLVRAYFEAIELAQPRAFLMENVSGFVTFQEGRILREVLELAQGLGYRTYPGVVLASLVGVPQRRRRFILVGVRDGGFHFPHEGREQVNDEPTLMSIGKTGYELVCNQRSTMETTVWSFNDATSDLPVLNAGESATEYATEAQNPYQQLMRKEAPAVLMDHVASKHKASFVEMMSHVPEGRSGMDPEIAARMPEAIRPKSGFPNSYARIRGSEPSPTITRNFTTPSSANCIHPRQHRSLTLREGARCQSFPDRYVFAGSHGDRRLMIGNAVPPLLATALGNAILDALPRNSSD
jgi:DNA (cytosine-5)-methyltransferase 1